MAGNRPDFEGTPLAHPPRRVGRLDAQGRIYWQKQGFPRERATESYELGERLAVVGDVWGDIDSINSGAGERLGYPTQKPVALLERILNASSNPGDLVLDPFCGCGTALVAAQKLDRRWVGDQCHVLGDRRHASEAEGQLWSRRYPGRRPADGS